MLSEVSDGVRAFRVFLFLHCGSRVLLLGKAQRIKEAKEEAKKEIEKYKQEREQLFQEQMKKVWFTTSRVLVVVRFPVWGSR